MQGGTVAAATDARTTYVEYIVASTAPSVRPAATSVPATTTQTAGACAEHSPRALAVKAVADRVLAALALVVLAPLLVGVAVAIRLTSPGAALFRQRRVGRDGRMFTMLKFRTMRAGAERELPGLLELNQADGGVLFKIRDDPRVTAVGRWLRRTSVDELPQLINVVVGSMSLVGPRPPLPHEVAAYPPAARRRLSVKPGLTGLWQISGRSDLTWDDAMRLDLSYVDEWSLGLDTAVLFKTFGAVLRADGAY